MNIYLDTIEEMTATVAGLVKEGLTFEVTKHADGFCIKLT